jgi:hypothetical protein
MNNITSAPKKMENPQTQPINKDVMDLVANKGKSKVDPRVRQAMDNLKKVMAEQGIDAQSLIKIGQLAEFALKDPKSYPMVMEQAIKAGFATPEDAQEKMNPKDFAGLASAGKLAQMIIDEGQST